MFGRAARVVTFLLLVELGVVVGAVGAFVHDTWAGVDGLSVPVGLLGALGGSAGLLLIARRAGSGRAGVAVAAGGWLLTAVLLSMRRPEGDLVIANTPVGYAFLWGGALLAALAVTLPIAPLRPATPGGSDRPAETLADVVRPAVERGDGE